MCVSVCLSLGWRVSVIPECLINDLLMDVYLIAVPCNTGVMVAVIKSEFSLEDVPAIET